MAQNIQEISFDEAKFEASKLRIIKGFDEIIAVSDKVNKLSIAPGSDGGFTELKANATGFTDAIKQSRLEQGKLKTELLQFNLDQKKASAERKANAASEKQASLDAVNAQRLKNAALAEERAEQGKLADINDVRVRNEEVYMGQVKSTTTAKKEQAATDALTGQEALKQAALRKQLEQEAQQQLKATIREELAEKGSLEQRRLALNRLTLEYDRLSAAQRNSPQGQRLGGVVSGLSQQVKDLEKEAGNRNRLNIGNYPGGAAGTPESPEAVSGGLGKIAGAAGNLFSGLRKIAYLIPGLGLAGLIGLLTEPIIAGIKALLDYGKTELEVKRETEQLDESLDHLKKTQLELRKAFGEPIMDVNRMEKELALMNAEGASREDLLKTEIAIAEKRATAANAKFFETGGFTKLADLQQKALVDQIAYTDAQTRANNAIKDRLTNKNGYSESDVKDLVEGANILEKIAQRSSEAAQEQKGIIDANFQTQKENLVKQAELKAYYQAQDLQKSTEFEKIDAQQTIDNADRKAKAITDENNRILADERNFEEKRNTAIKSSSNARIKDLETEADERKRIISADLRKTVQNPSNKNADGTLTAEAVVAQRKAAADVSKINKDLQQNITDEIKDRDIKVFDNEEVFRKRRLTAELDAAKDIAEIYQNTNEDISKSYAHNFAERIAAYSNYFTSQQELIKKNYEFEKATRILTAEELLALDADFAKQQATLAAKGQKEISDIYVSAEDAESSMEQLRSKRALAADELSLYNRLKKKKDFANQAAILEYNENYKSLKSDEEHQHIIINSTQTTAEAKVDANKKLLEDQTNTDRLLLQQQQYFEAQRADARMAAKDIEKQEAQELFTFINTLVQARYENEINAIQKQMDANTAAKNIEIENISNSTISAQEKAAQIQIINAQATAQAEELSQKQIALKVKEAKYERAAKAAEIIGTTAVGVISLEVKAAEAIAQAAVLASNPLTAGFAPAATAAAAAITAEIAATIGLGAISIATLFATPLPTFGEGTDSAPGGPAIVGEKRMGSGYQKELVETPDGKSFITSGPMLLSNLPKKSKVTPLTDSIDWALNNSMIAATAYALQGTGRYNSDRTLREVRDAVYETGRMTAQALKKQKAAHTTININSNFGSYIQKAVRE